MGSAAAQTIGVGAVISQSSVALTFTMDGGKVISGTGMFTGSLLAGPDHAEGTLTGPTANDTGDWAFTVTKARTAAVKKTCRAQSASCLSAKQYDATCVTKTLTSLNAIGAITSTHTTDFTSLAQKNCCDQLVFNTVAGCGCRFGSAL